MLADGFEVESYDAQMRRVNCERSGVGLMERARIARQPAHLLLASEFGSATLNEKGSGEYDPSFVITSLVRR